jgi:hypothetical protein
VSLRRVTAGVSATPPPKKTDIGGKGLDGGEGGYDAEVVHLRGRVQTTIVCYDDGGDNTLAARHCGRGGGGGGGGKGGGG